MGGNTDTELFLNVMSTTNLIDNNNTNDGTKTDPDELGQESILESDAIGTEAKSAPRKPVTEIRSLEQLLREVYESAKPRLSLKRSEVVALEAADLGIDNVRAELLNLAENDRTLDCTLQLMVISTKFEGSETKTQITDFVREVLKYHPAFYSGFLAEFLDDRIGSVSEDRALRSLVSQNYASLPWPSGHLPLKKAQTAKCKANALQCLLLLIWSTREISLVRILDLLRTHVWARKGSRSNAESLQAVALIQARDATGATIIYDQLKTVNAKTVEALKASRIDEQNAIARAEDAERKLREVESIAHRKQIEIQALMNQVKSLTDDYANYKALSKDAYETLRGRVLNTLRSEVMLLDEGLHALRRDSPKIHVMDDHAERAMDALKSEIARLEERA